MQVEKAESSPERLSVGQVDNGPLIRGVRSNTNFEKTELQGIPRNLLKGTEQIRHRASLDAFLSGF